MSDKKITELQLRSNVNEDVNFPVDDGIQTYRVSAPQVQDYVLSTTRDSKSLLNYGLTASVGTGALTIALKNMAGSNPSSASPVSFAFRNVTLTTGAFEIVKATAATSLVVSSGSKLGSVDAIKSILYVYAINNGGTIELGVSASKFDEGTVHSSTAEGGAGGADSHDLLYSTTSRSNKAIRLIGRIVSTQSTAGTWASAPSEIALPPFNSMNEVSEIWLQGDNGFATSPNLYMRRFTGAQLTVGTAISFTDSSSEGSILTINEDGIYAISYTDQYGVQGQMSITLNQPDLTKATSQFTQTDMVLAACYSGGSNIWNTCAGIKFLKAGDVIRFCGDGSAAGSNTALIGARITKVA